MYDLVVIGAGPGGMAAARGAARLGARVAMIERRQAGGECALVACVPSKALLRAAQVAHEARQAGRFGVEVGDVRVDFRSVMERVRALVREFTAGDAGDKLESQGIGLIPGEARFEAYDTVVVGDGRRVEGRRFVIATGSSPAHPEVPGLRDAGALDNATVWGLEERPEELAILGGGASGLEFAQAFARLGSRVTVLESGERILGDEDPEVSAAVQEALEGEGIAIRTGARVGGVVVRDGRKVVSYRDRVGSEPLSLSATHLLVATGRRANVEGLNLEALHIYADPARGIEVDDQLQTHAPNVYALGDVIGHHQWTHAAERQAQIVVRNALLRRGEKIDYRGIPRVVFTDPEVAAVGDTVEAARRAEPDAQVHRIELAKVDRARIDGTPAGFAQVVASPGGKVLGAAVVGREASSIVQVFALAIQQGLSLADVAEGVVPYPTYLGVARSLALRHEADRTGRSVLHGAVRWLLGLGGADRGSGRPAEEPVHAGEPGHH